jgi:hypothetical protein
MTPATTRTALRLDKIELVPLPTPIPHHLMDLAFRDLGQWIWCARLLTASAAVWHVLEVALVLWSGLPDLYLIDTSRCERWHWEANLRW